jgi:hypothetical protein
MRTLRTLIISVALAATAALSGCGANHTLPDPATLITTAEVKLNNDLAPVVRPDLVAGVEDAKAQVPVYDTGLNCAQGLLAWWDALPTTVPPAPTQQQGVGFVSGLIALHGVAYSATPIAPIPLPDDKTRAYCALLLMDDANIGSILKAKLAALFSAVAAGKGVPIAPAVAASVASGQSAKP